MAFRSKIAASLRKMSSASQAHTLLLENMNPCIKKMEYAVRGPLVIRATEIEKVFFEVFLVGFHLLYFTNFV